MFKITVLFMLLSMMYAIKTSINIGKKSYAISQPYYIQKVPRHIPKTELLPPYEIPKWVYHKVFKKNKPNKYKD